MAIAKVATPTRVAPGETVTYTLLFSNRGTGLARNVLISDSMPLSVTITGIASSSDDPGVIITKTNGAPDFVWAVSDLRPGSSGILTLTGNISTSADVAGTSFSNVATISADGEITFTNNSAAADVTVKPLLTVGGTLSGLAGSGLVLQNNGADDLALSAMAPLPLSHHCSMAATIR